MRRYALPASGRLPLAVAATLLAGLLLPPLLSTDSRSPRRPTAAEAVLLASSGTSRHAQVRARVGARLASSRSSGAARATGQRRLAILLVAFAGDPRRPWTPAQVRAVAFTGDDSVAAYFAEATAGRLQLTGTVGGWLTIPARAGSCDFEAWGRAADQAAHAAGLDVSAYDFVSYAFPEVEACDWAGLGLLPGRTSWLNNSATDFAVLAHEIGHNLGLGHAGTIRCRDEGGRAIALAADTATACDTDPYGDPFTVMGSSTSAAVTAVARGDLDALAPHDTRTVRSSGEYRLRPLGSTGDEPQTLRVPRAGNGYLALELRRPAGTPFTSYGDAAPVVNGISVRLASEYGTGAETYLVDATPGTPSFADAPLQPGRSLADPLAGAVITTVATGPAGATVRVSFDGDTVPAMAAPLAATGAADSLSAPTGLRAVRTRGRLTLRWRPGPGDTEPKAYRVYVDGRLARVVPAAVTSTSLDASGRGMRVLAVEAVDAAGNAGPRATVTVSFR